MVKILVVILAIATVVAGSNTTDNIEGGVVRNSRGIVSSLANIFRSGSSDSSSSSCNSSSRSSSNSGSFSNGDTFEIIQLSPVASAGIDIKRYDGVARASGATHTYGGSYGGSHSSVPQVPTHVVGQFGQGSSGSINSGFAGTVSTGWSSVFGHQVPVQPAPSGGCGCACGCGSCSSANNIEYVHINHPPKVIEEVVEHHIEHPPPLIETFVEHVVEHPPQIIEHRNHIIERVPRILLARPHSHSSQESHSSSHHFASDVGGIVGGVVAGKIAKKF